MNEFKISKHMKKGGIYHDKEGTLFSPLLIEKVLPTFSKSSPYSSHSVSVSSFHAVMTTDPQNECPLSVSPFHRQTHAQSAHAVLQGHCLLKQRANMANENFRISQGLVQTQTAKQLMKKTKHTTQYSVCNTCSNIFFTIAAPSPLLHNYVIYFCIKTSGSQLHYLPDLLNVFGLPGASVHGQWGAVHLEASRRRRHHHFTPTSTPRREWTGAPISPNCEGGSSHIYVCVYLWW